MTTIDDSPRLGDTLLEAPWHRIIEAEDNVRVLVDYDPELAVSIAQLGLLQPLVVIELGPDQHEGENHGTMMYRLVAGHRRKRAIGIGSSDKKLSTEVHERLAVLNDALPILVKPAMDDPTRIEAMLVENLQRRDINPVEEAHGYERLTTELNWSQKEISRRTGRSASVISARLALLKLPEVLIDKIRSGTYPVSGAEVLRSLAGDDKGILKLTEEGTKVPQQYQVDEYVKRGKAKKIADDLSKAAHDRGITVSREYINPYAMKTLAVVETVADLDTLTAASIKKGTLYISVESWSGAVTAKLCRPITEAEKTKQQERDQAKRAEVQDRRQAEIAELDAKRKESLPDVVREWEQACEEAAAAHTAAMVEYGERIASVEAAWLDSVDAKKVAAWAMRSVIQQAYDWDLARSLDLQDIDGDPRGAIEAYINQGGAKALIRAAAVSLVELYVDDNEPPALEDKRQFLSKHHVDKPELVLPDPPAGYDRNGEPIDPEAEAAIAEQDAAAEAPQDNDGFDDPGPEGYRDDSSDD